MDVKREWLEEDYYATLGVSEGANQADITKAYRKLAREYHPDTNPGDRAAEDRFKEISAAYDVLGDPDTRGKYDQVRTMGPMMGGPGGAGMGGNGVPFDVDLGDLFGGLFGDRGGDSPFGGFGARTRPRPQPGRDQETSISLSFDEAVRGLTTEVTIGTGAGGGPRTMKIRIPAGVEDGQRIRLRGKGGGGTNGGPPGDLYVLTRVAPHHRFGRSGRHLTLTQPIEFHQAALGADISVPTFDGADVKLRIPAGTPSGKTFRVKGRGGPGPGSGGDLLVTVEVIVPTELTAEQRAAIEALAAAVSGENPSSAGRDS